MQAPYVFLGETTFVKLRQLEKIQRDFFFETYYQGFDGWNLFKKGGRNDSMVE